MGIGLFLPGGMQIIQSEIVGADGLASMTFSAIPQTYHDLLLTIVGQTTTVSTSGQSIYMNLNSDDGNNYSFQKLIGNGSSAGASRNTAQSIFRLGTLTGSGNGTSLASSVHVWLPHYAQTSWYKQILSFAAEINTTSDIEAEMNAGIWLSSEAVSRIDLTPNSGNFAQNTLVVLYGM